MPDEAKKLIFSCEAK